MLLGLTHMCFPRARRHTRKFFELSYYNPQTTEYRAGWNDAWMVFYWIVVFTGLRAAVMDYVLLPFAKKAGVKTARDETRFAEQSWLIIYYMVFWPIGMVGRVPPSLEPVANLDSVHSCHFGLLDEPQKSLGELAQSRNRRSAKSM